MFEIVTAPALAFAAGYRAFLPLLFTGLASKYFDLFSLPAGWAWLENPWFLSALGVLAVLDFLADKFPGVDHINDIIQTLIRPTSGGILLTATTTSEALTITDPATFFSSGQWLPFALGFLLALGGHGAKASVRAGLNPVSAGIAAPFVSTAEDVTSITLTVTAILLPALAFVILIAIVWFYVATFRRLRRRRGQMTAEPPPTSPTT